MRALEFVRDRTSKEPAGDLVQAIARLCYERGLLVIPAGTYGNVIRTLMPLVITDDQLEEGLDVLEGAILEAARDQPPGRPAGTPGIRGITLAYPVPCTDPLVGGDRGTGNENTHG